MTSDNFKQFNQWLRKKGLILKKCNCGMYYENEHDVECALVKSEEEYFEQWRNEASGEKS